MNTLQDIDHLMQVCVETHAALASAAQAHKEALNMLNSAYNTLFGEMVKQPPSPPQSQSTDTGVQHFTPGKS